MMIIVHVSVLNLLPALLGGVAGVHVSVAVPPQVAPEHRVAPASEVSCKKYYQIKYMYYLFRDNP